MKKSLMVPLLLVFLQCIFYSHPWQLRLVPLCKDTMTGGWHALFWHDAYNGCKELHKSMDSSSFTSNEISTFLTSSTHGLYTYSPEQLEKISCSIRLSNGDIVCYIAVPYVCANDFNKKTITGYHNFIWMPIEELLRRRTIVKSPRGRSMAYILDMNIKKYFQDYWYSTVLPIMATKTAISLKSYTRNGAKKIQTRYEFITNNAKNITAQSLKQRGAIKSTTSLRDLKA